MNDPPRSIRRPTIVLALPIWRDSKALAYFVWTRRPIAP